MRIALVDNSRGWGGAEEILFSLAKGLVKRGHHVGLFLREGSEAVAKFSEAGFDVWTIHRSGLRMFSGLATMVSVIRDKRFELIHVHRNHDLLTGKVVGFLAGRLPLVLTQHCWLGRTSFAMINLADRIAAVSQFIADGMAERFPALAGKLRVVHNGIDLAAFEPPYRDYWGGRPQLADKGPLLGVVGYFYKNQEELIELVPRIRAVFPQAVLVIIGDDTSKRHLLEAKVAETGVADAVYFAGTVPHTEMKHALAGLDLNVSAFRREGFGLSVIEGMAVGTPFVGYRAGGYREIVVQGENGYLVETHQELGDVLIELLGDSERLKRLRDNARSRVSAQFSVDAMLLRYETLYAELVGARP